MKFELISDGLSLGNLFARMEQAQNDDGLNVADYSISQNNLDNVSNTVFFSWKWFLLKYILNLTGDTLSCDWTAKNITMYVCSTVMSLYQVERTDFINYLPKIIFILFVVHIFRIMIYYTILKKCSLITGSS